MSSGLNVRRTGDGRLKGQILGLVIAAALGMDGQFLVVSASQASQQKQRAFTNGRWNPSGQLLAMRQLSCGIKSPRLRS